MTLPMKMRILSQTDNRWIKEVLQEKPWFGKENRGRLQTWWIDTLKLIAGLNWAGRAQNTDSWRQIIFIIGWQWADNEEDRSSRFSFFSEAIFKIHPGCCENYIQRLRFVFCRMNIRPNSPLVGMHKLAYKYCKKRD